MEYIPGIVAGIAFFLCVMAIPYEKDYVDGLDEDARKTVLFAYDDCLYSDTRSSKIVYFGVYAMALATFLLAEFIDEKVPKFVLYLPALLYAVSVTALGSRVTLLDCKMERPIANVTFFVSIGLLASADGKSIVTYDMLHSVMALYVIFIIYLYKRIGTIISLASHYRYGFNKYQKAIERAEALEEELENVKQLYNQVLDKYDEANERLYELKEELWYYKQYKKRPGD